MRGVQSKRPRPASAAALALSALCIAGPLYSAGTPAVSAPRDRGEQIVETAMKYIGARYRYGGTGSGGFDCSGFVMTVYGQYGIRLRHAADWQYDDGVKIQPQDLRPGDLVFYRIYRNRISHVGIYTGNGKFIHSPRWGHVVSITDMNLPYWKSRFAGAATYLRKTAEDSNADVKKTAEAKPLEKKTAAPVKPSR